MGRVIGIDFGLKRTGLAVTDPDQWIATPLTVVATHDLMAYLKAYLKEETVDGFVLGMPLSTHGTPTDSTSGARRLHEKLESTFPEKFVTLVDERYTSSLALDAMITGGTKKKYRRQKGNIDKISATIILQSYLEQKKAGGD